MTIYDWLTVVAVVICLLVSAFYSGSETALTASSRAAMMRLEKHGNVDAGIVNRLLAARERFLGAVLLANNATNIAASTLATGLLLTFFGHALEAACGFSDRLLHGEAIAAGMALAFEFSARRQGLLPMDEAKRAIRHLAEVGLPTRLQDIPGPLPSVDQLMELIAQDKKVKRGMLTFILVRGIGSAFIEAGVDAREVRVFLSEKLAEQ